MISTRLATIADLDEIVAIENACFSPAWSRILFEADLGKNPHARYWLGEKDGRIVSFVGTHDAAGEINITNVATLPEHQNQGIAAAVLDEVLKYFTREYTGTLYGITLEVRSGNKPAIALYKKFGFKEEGIRKAYYQDGEDALIMWIR